VAKIFSALQAAMTAGPAWREPNPRLDLLLAVGRQKEKNCESSQAKRKDEGTSILLRAGHNAV
jgi:hypothetical protein